MKTIATTYVYRSTSNAATFYQALHYTDGSTSCDCPGWTRRVQGDGSRTCKHIREIEAGNARLSCIRFVEHMALLAGPEFPNIYPNAKQAKPMRKAMPVIQQDLPGRVFDLD